MDEEEGGGGEAGDQVKMEEGEQEARDSLINKLLGEDRMLSTLLVKQTDTLKGWWSVLFLFIFSELVTVGNKNPFTSL